MEYKIAWFTEGGWQGKVRRDHPNMRNDMAWMNTFDVTHYPIQMIDKITEKFDIGIMTIPKTNIDNLSQFSLIQPLKKICKRVGTMQEGPHWYFQDYTMEQQIWFYNLLMELDFIWCHNEIDKQYYQGLTNKKCYVNPTLMIEDFIKPKDETEVRSGVMIGGNMCRWYGGFDSYIVAQEFGEDIYAPSMGRKIEREEEMDINHLPYMTWVEWINNLSKYKYGVHLMPTQAAGTFTLNCAYHGIPCIGYKGLDTQTKCHPNLNVEYGDIDAAKKLAYKLKTNSEFYKLQSQTAKNNYNHFFGEKEYTYTMNKVIREVMNESN